MSRHARRIFINNCRTKYLEKNFSPYKTRSLGIVKILTIVVRPFEIKSNQIPSLDIGSQWLTVHFPETRIAETFHEDCARARRFQSVSENSISNNSDRYNVGVTYIPRYRGIRNGENSSPIAFAQLRLPSRFNGATFSQNFAGKMHTPRHVQQIENGKSRRADQ